MKKKPLLFFFICIFFFYGCEKRKLIPTILVQKVYSGSVPLRAVCFTDELHGYVGGDEGTFLTTADGGNSWSQVNVGPNTTANYNCISFPSHDTGWVAGEPGTSGGASAYSTFDGGQSWQYRGGYPSRFLTFVTNHIGYRDDSNDQLCVTMNSGTTWNNIGEPYTDDHFSAFFFLNKDTGFLGANAFSTTGDYMTTNGGATWNVIHFSNLDNEAWEYAFADRNNGVVSFSNGNFNTTHDGGMTWQSCSSTPLDNHFPANTICMPSSKIVIAGGEYYLLISVDGGDTWTQYFQQDGTSFPGEINKVYFYDPYNGYAVTKQGAIYRLKRVDPK